MTSLECECVWMLKRKHFAIEKERCWHGYEWINKACCVKCSECSSSRPFNIKFLSFNKNQFQKLGIFWQLFHGPGCRLLGCANKSAHFFKLWHIWWSFYVFFLETCSSSPPSPSACSQINDILSPPLQELYFTVSSALRWLQLWAI